MYLEEFNLTQGTQLPYPNRPTEAAPTVLGAYDPLNAGQLPYPGYITGDPFAPSNPIFNLSAVPQFTVTSPLIPASMLTPVKAEGECVAAPFYGLGSTQTAYLASQGVTVPGGVMEGTGDLRNVLEPILLADLLLGI